MAERPLDVRKVVGSNPTPPTKILKYFRITKISIIKNLYLIFATEESKVITLENTRKIFGNFKDKNRR